MKAAYFLLLIAGVVIFAVILVYAAVRSSDPNRMTRREKQELQRLRDLVDTLDQLAYSHRELDSALAVQVIDEIRRSKKELR